MENRHGDAALQLQLYMSGVKASIPHTALLTIFQSVASTNHFLCPPQSMNFLTPLREKIGREMPYNLLTLAGEVGRPSGKGERLSGLRCCESRPLNLKGGFFDQLCRRAFFEGHLISEATVVIVDELIHRVG